MSHKTVNRVRAFLASTILSKRIWSQASSRSCSSAKLQNMEAAKSLKDLGYAFNDAGQLRKLGADGQPTEEPFQFNVSNQHQECQAHYEQLGTAVTEYIYHLLQTDMNLIRLSVPKGSDKGTFIFASQDYDKKDVLIILIHGSGAVRAGQWARSLIINDNLDMGSQIPYVKYALSRDYGVLILNPNDNALPNGQKIPHSGSGEEHASYVWNTYVQGAKAASIAIVAHSYGGVLTVTLADQMKKGFEKRVKAIAFTDSVHVYSNIKITKHLKEVSVNWISSQSPLDTPMTTPDFDIPRLSAVLGGGGSGGHILERDIIAIRPFTFTIVTASDVRCPGTFPRTGNVAGSAAGNVPNPWERSEKHEMTSYSCKESVFQFIDKKLSKK